MQVVILQEFEEGRRWYPKDTPDVDAAIARRWIQEGKATYRNTTLPATNAAKLQRWVSALSKVMAGTGHAKVLLLGDSTDVGAGAGTGSGNLVGASAKSVAVNLVTRLLAQGVPACRDNMMGDQNVYFSPLGANYGQYDTRCVLTSANNITDGNAYIFGGLMFTPNPGGSTPTGKIAFTPANPIDSIEVTYINNITGSATVDVDGGGALTTITNSGANSIAKTATLNPAKGAHTINITGVSGALGVACIDAWDSTTPRVRVFTGGMYGSKIDQIAATTRYYHPGNSAPWTLYNFDLVVIDMTINSMVGDGAAGVANYISKMQTVIGNAQAAGASVILATPNPVAVATVPAATANAYLSAIYKLAADYGCLVAGTHEAFNNSQTAANAQGMYTDDRHPNAVGYQLKAAVYVDAMLSVA